MPRITPAATRDRWFAEYQAGKSVASIARAAHSDPRTVQRAIDRIGETQAQAQARAELQRDGLRRHQQELLNLIGEVARSVAPLPGQSGLGHPARPAGSSFEMGTYRIAGLGTPSPTLELALEAGLWWGLLREHLGSDRAYSLLGDWKQAVLEEVVARLSLRRDVIDGFSTLGLDVAEGIERTGTVTPLALYHADRAAVSLALAEEVPQPFEVTGGDADTWYVNSDGIGGKLPRGGRLVAEEISSVPAKAASASAGSHVRKAHERAAAAAQRARTAFEELGASFYVRGWCRSCRP